MIEVRLFATLREGRDKILHLDASSFSTGMQIIEHLDIPAKEVAIYLINGFHSKLEDPIKEGDVLAIFPPVGGG